MSLLEIRILSLFVVLSASLAFLSLGKAEPSTPSKEAPALTGLFSQTRILMQTRNWSEIESLLSKALQNSPPQDQLEILHFQLGFAQMNQQKYQDAATQFDLSQVKGESLRDYSLFFRAQMSEKLADPVLAEKLYGQVRELSPNIRLRIEVEKNLARLMIEKKDYRSARPLLLKLERKVRGIDESAPIILSQLARSEKGLKNPSGACRWLRKIYSHYPQDENFRHWNHNLATNIFENEPTRCLSEDSDFKLRVSTLLGVGLETKALSEIQAFRKERQEKDPYFADSLLAQYHLQQGEGFKAQEILKAYFPEKQRNMDFLLAYALASARGSAATAAVGTYYQAHLLAPKSADGRRALYNAAFLSYQNQDYDGSSRKFQEFLKKYAPGGNPSRHVPAGMIRDAQWYIAWLKYLRGDFSGAYQNFARVNQGTQQKRKVPTRRSDRTQYWMAMSLLRQGELEGAQELFEPLSQDPLLGYYAMASGARLRQIQTQIQAKNNLKRKDARLQSLALAELSLSERKSRAELLLAGREGPEFETETADQASLGEKNESVESEASRGEKTFENGPGVDWSTQKASVAQRFQKARDLRTLGLFDWAKWDLYEIEKKTKNKDYLKSLMSEYSELKNYHRSAYIAQVHFAKPRTLLSINESKALWQGAYPQAFSDDVIEHAKKYEVPAGLIWGIMRAESHYRQDALSPVGAIGLMQIMPRTAQRMSDKLGMKDFSIDLLLSPRVAINLGAGYLKRLLGQFNQNPSLAAAAYNAGPHRVMNWLKAFGTLQMDEFIEHIPFQETRNYVQKVMTNQQIYSLLYQLNQDVSPMLATALEVTPPEKIAISESWD